MAPQKQHYIVAFGGTTRAGSSGERALMIALGHAERAGARTRLFTGVDLAQLPHYAPENQERSPQQQEFVNEVKAADGILIASPGYHGGVSGLVKNAIDLLEDLRASEQVYLDGRAVGCIVTAAGWQAGGTTLAALRGIVHALRGWPTPLGVILNTAAGPLFDVEGKCLDSAVDRNLELLASQVLQFSAKFRP